MVRGYLNSLIGARSGFLNISESVNYSWCHFKTFKEMAVFIRELEKDPLLVISKSSKNCQFSLENWRRKGGYKSGYLMFFQFF